MKEFMLLIRNEINHHASWPPEKSEAFLKQCEVYINTLKAAGSCFRPSPWCGKEG